MRLNLGGVVFLGGDLWDLLGSILWNSLWTDLRVDLGRLLDAALWSSLEDSLLRRIGSSVRRVG